MAKKAAKTKSRSNGEGSIFKRKDGRWCAVLTVGIVGKRQIRRTRVVTSQADARTALAALKLEYATTSHEVDRRLDDFIKEWLRDEVKPRLSDNTAYLYDKTAERHVLPHLGLKLLRELRPLTIKNWLKLLKEDGVGTRTQQVAYNTLQTALDYAISLEYIPENPVKTQRRPKHESEEIDPFDEREIDDILSHTRGTDLYVACVIALVLGLRESELFGLRMIDIDLKKMTLTVAQQAKERGKSRFGKLKTKAAYRTIAIPPVVANAIIEHQKLKLVAGLAGNELLFPSAEGEPWFRSNFIRRRWIPLLESLKIRHRGFHHCRHSAATQMLSAKPPISPTTVAHILGHANASITLRIYAHYLPAHGADAVASLENRFG